MKNIFLFLNLKRCVYFMLQLRNETKFCLPLMRTLSPVLRSVYLESTSQGHISLPYCQGNDAPIVNVIFVLNQLFRFHKTLQKYLFFLNILLSWEAAMSGDNQRLLSTMCIATWKSHLNQMQQYKNCFHTCKK